MPVPEEVREALGLAADNEMTRQLEDDETPNYAKVGAAARSLPPSSLAPTQNEERQPNEYH